MKFGLTIFPTDYAIGPIELARLAEERGFESLFLPEHTHIPVSRATPYPAGGELPQEYWRKLDPFVGLAAAAAVTERLMLGTGICLIVQRDPITTAKEVASVDHISNGRFLFGIGAGWNEEEMRNHGTDPRTRLTLMRERVEAMKVIWSEDEAEYHGKLVDFDPIWSWPKPVQKPHPPILVGGYAEPALKRVVGFGDEWIPNPGVTLSRLPGMAAELQRLAGEAGRDPIPITFFGARPDLESLERYAAAGVHRCVFLLPPEGRDVVEPLVDRFAQLAEAYVS